MLNKILSIFQFLVIIFFIFLTSYFYFSDRNVNEINKNRANLPIISNRNLDFLPLLNNDTNNIIEYQNNDKIIEKIKKRSFWDLLK